MKAVFDLNHTHQFLTDHVSRNNNDNDDEVSVCCNCLAHLEPICDAKIETSLLTMQ